MFHALSSALEGALAPDIPPVVDFRHQWNMFLRQGQIENSMRIIIKADN